MLTMERLAQARADSINKEIFLQRNVEKKNDNDESSKNASTIDIS